MRLLQYLLFAVATAFTMGCAESPATHTGEEPMSTIDRKLQKYVPFKLTTDLSQLTEKEKQMLPILIKASKIMNELFWFESYGDKTELMKAISDEATQKFVDINYGPWDRLDGNQPFVTGIEKKPDGANFYPADMTKEEFETAELEGKESLYTFIRRDEDGNLMTIPYHEMFPEQVKKVAELLAQAADLAEDEGLRKYLTARSEAVLTDDYTKSDVLWLDMETNTLDIIIGPIESYEDQLYGYKTAHEAYVLVKDKSWSQRLAKYAALLPDLQKGLPVDAKYKTEVPGGKSQLNAYDVVYYAGDCNSGSKTIAVNLPNDAILQLRKGTRRSQLKNAMQAKFDKILIPIAEQLITEEQRQYITFNAFFSNTMFHEVAHGLGIKNTIDGEGTVTAALKEHASALEEGKADVLGLYMITQLHKMGEIEGDLKEYFTTFVTSIFRSVRFGASSAHGKANMIRFNYFQEKGAFSRNEDSTYTIHYDKFTEAMNSLSELILTLQGDGDYDGVAKLVADKGVIKPELQADLDRLGDLGIPVDVIFEQGVEALGL